MTFVTGQSTAIVIGTQYMKYAGHLEKMLGKISLSEHRQSKVLLLSFPEKPFFQNAGHSN